MIVWNTFGTFFKKFKKKVEEKLNFPCPVLSFECNNLDGYTVY